MQAATHSTIDNPLPAAFIASLSGPLCRRLRPVVAFECIASAAPSADAQRRHCHILLRLLSICTSRCRRCRPRLRRCCAGCRRRRRRRPSLLALVSRQSRRIKSGCRPLRRALRARTDRSPCVSRARVPGQQADEALAKVPGHAPRVHERAAARAARQRLARLGGRRRHRRAHHSCIRARANDTSCFGRRWPLRNGVCRRARMLCNGEGQRVVSLHCGIGLVIARLSQVRCNQLQLDGIVALQVGERKNCERDSFAPSAVRADFGRKQLEFFHEDGLEYCQLRRLFLLGVQVVGVVHGYFRPLRQHRARYGMVITPLTRICLRGPEAPSGRHACLSANCYSVLLHDPAPSYFHGYDITLISSETDEERRAESQNRRS
eukprot:6214124-Pleurochrysis_carterae.AAC.2